MKKNLMLLALTGVIALASCSTLPPLPARIDPAMPSAPIVVTLPADAPVPTPQPAPVAQSITVIGNPEAVGVPWLEVTAFQAARSPGDGANCSAVASVASADTDKSLTIRSTNCGDAGTATLTVTLNGQSTPERVGGQDLVIVQKRSGNIEAVSAIITINGEQIWPRQVPHQ